LLGGEEKENDGIDTESVGNVKENQAQGKSGEESTHSGRVKWDHYSGETKSKLCVQIGNMWAVAGARWFFM
jgi:hypothetical protein